MAARALLWLGILTVGLNLFPGRSSASQMELPEEVSLQRLIEEYEAVGRELLRAGEALKTASTETERRGIRAQIQQLQARQQELLEALETKMGHPPRIQDEPPASAEERLEAQRLRDEAVLDKDVERRLPQ